MSSVDEKARDAGLGGSPNVPIIERAGLQDVVLAWAMDDSVSYDEMSRRLLDEYGVSISAKSVGKWVGRQRDDRRVAMIAAAASDPALQERLSQHATSDLDMAQSVLDDLITTYRGVKGIDAKVSIARALFDGLRTKAKLTGLDGAGSGASAVAAVAVVGGGRLRDLTDDELHDLLRHGQEEARTDDGTVGFSAGRQPGSQAGGLDTEPVHGRAHTRSTEGGGVVDHGTHGRTAGGY